MLSQIPDDTCNFPLLTIVDAAGGGKELTASNSRSAVSPVSGDARAKRLSDWCSELLAWIADHNRVTGSQTEKQRGCVSHADEERMRKNWFLAPGRGCASHHSLTPVLEMFLLTVARWSFKAVSLCFPLPSAATATHTSSSWRTHDHHEAERTFPSFCLTFTFSLLLVPLFTPLTHISVTKRRSSPDPFKDQVSKKHSSLWVTSVVSDVICSHCHEKMPGTCSCMHKCRSGRS